MSRCWRPAAFWRLEKNRPVCTLCPFGCAPDVGKSGRCRVRRRGVRGWETTAFASAVYHWHPVERKPFFHLLPGSQTLTLAMPGCTFRCDYCENAVLSQVENPENPGMELLPWHPEAVLAEVAAAKAMLAFSYTEPILAAEMLLEIAPLARQAGVKILWNSNGFITPEALAMVAPSLFAVNLDLKTMDPQAHGHLTGAPLAPVLATMAGLAERGVWLEISTPLIPGFNDDEAMIRKMAREITTLGAQTPWHLLRFHPDHHRTHAPPTPLALLNRARELAWQEGLHHVYPSHSLDPAARHTLCPGCKKMVVQRHESECIRLDLHAGSCPNCHTPIAGRW